MSKRVLVTGGAGFIGSHVSDVFIANGWAVEIVDDLSSGKRSNVPAEATFHEIDIRSPEASRLVKEGKFDVIVHLAAQMDVRRSVADPLFDASVNVLGSLNILEAVRNSERAQQTRVVFSSTGGAIYGDLATPPTVETTPKEPDSPYAITKLAVEHYLSYYTRIHGLETVVIRFGNVYGPRQDPHGEAGVVAIFLRTCHAKPSAHDLWRRNADPRLRPRDGCRRGGISRCDDLAAAGAASRRSRVQHRHGQRDVRRRPGARAARCRRGRRADRVCPATRR
jgi:nucleoside-diphosphate-sugar epimerase